MTRQTIRAAAAGAVLLLATGSEAPGLVTEDSELRTED
jgi:hypothetical protein